ncbi:MAG: methyltransferase domain-containing protein [Saprospiraceae bacterium]|nr:methyltransferase domain-containing protein [Saprospiraceae bacterium]
MNLRWKIAQAIEFRWWQQYLKKKPVSDYLAWKKDYWKTFLEKIDIHPIKEDKILDVGCGPAGIFIVLPDVEVDAVDPLLDQYEENLPHFNKENYPNTIFLTTPFEDLNSAKKYDKIFCLNAINHVSDLKKCFQKLNELLGENGTLILSIDAHNYSLFKYIFRALPGDILHPHQYDLSEYKDMVSDLGMTIQKTVLYKQEFFFNYHIIIAKK